MLSDFRFALRTLAKAPGFTAVAVATLALAIGANTAIFALVNDLLLRPLVPGAPAQVVNVFHGQTQANADYRSFSWREIEALRQPNAVFSEVAAVNFALAGVGDGESVRRTFAFFATENLLDLFGTLPARGRFFTAAESAPGADVPVVVASHSLWQRSGGDDDFIGSNLRINGRPYTVIGVTPKRFTLGHATISPEVWLPFGTMDQFGSMFADAGGSARLLDPHFYRLNAVGRLHREVDLPAATTMLAALDQQLAAIDVDPTAIPRALEIQVPSRFSISTEPSNDTGLSIFGSLLLGMASVVLLIACLNLANMLLARGTARTKEIAVRLAIGASRWRIIRQLLVEGLVLALAGGGAGLLLSLWANDLMIASLDSLFASMSFAFIVEAEPNGTILLATFGFCLVATLAFSLGPALKASRVDVVNDLKSQGGEAAVIGRWNRFFSARNCLVMGQIALSLALIFAAGLFLRGALNAGGLDLGFDAQSGVVAELDYSLSDRDAAAARQQFLSLRERVGALPGVTAAAISSQAPYSNTTNSVRLQAADAPPPDLTDPDAPAPGYLALNYDISEDYFAALGVPLLRGRTFTAIEVSNPDAPRVAIIDQRMAESLFPEREALGERIRYTTPEPDGTYPEFEVVGISASFRNEVFSADPSRRVFFPFARGANPNAFLHVRGPVDGRDAALGLVTVTRNLIQQVDPTAPVLLIEPLADFVDKNIGLWIVRMGAVLFGIFGGVALVLAATGVYGVKAYGVARRTREIGVRMALGAEPKDIFALIMNQGTLQAAVGLVVGLGLALGAGQLLAQMLFRVSPFDPMALSVAALVLAVATLFACFLPARKATKVNPTQAMRSE